MERLCAFLLLKMTKILKNIVLSCFISLLLSLPVMAKQELFSTSLSDLQNIPVSSIDFSNRSLHDSFASAFVITDDMIDNMPLFFVGDYLQMLIPGVMVVPQGNNGAGLGVRGSARGGGVRTLVLWDGHSLNRNNDGGNMSIYYSPFLGDVEQMEVVLGPGSVKHGTGALHGYINFVPKNGYHHAGQNIQLDYGANNLARRLQLDKGWSYGAERHVYVYAGYFEANGFQADDDFGGRTSTALNERRKFLNRDELTVGNYEPSYKLSANWTHDRFNLKALYEHLEFNPNGLVSGVDSLNQRTTFSLQPKYTFQLPYRSSLELSSAIGLFDKSRIRQSIAGDNVTETGGSESATELKMVLQSRHFDQHHLAIGVQAKLIDTSSQKHFFSANPNQHRQYVDGRWAEYSVYIEDNYQLNDKTTITSGLRFDAADFTDEFSFFRAGRTTQRFQPEDISNTSPRLAMTYKADNDFLYRIVYQEGFAYPTVSEYPLLFVLNDFLRNQQLNPQQTPLQSRQAEVLKDLEIGLRGELIKNKLHFDLTAHYNRYKNRGRFVPLTGNNATAILADDVAAALPSNIGGVVIGLDNDVDGYGAELALDWQPNDQFLGSISYAYTVPKQVNALDNQFAQIATNDLSEWRQFSKHQWKLNGQYQHRNWRVNLAAIYQSGINADDAFVTGNNPLRDDYVRVNLGVAYQINRTTKASLVVNNVFANDTPQANINTSRPWLGSLGSDERLAYFSLRFAL